MRENDEAFRKKMYNFYDKNFIKKTKEESDFSSVVLVDPLGEYKHIEKRELEEQKEYENKLQNKEQKNDDEEKSAVNNQASQKDGQKKKKVIFDDVRQNLKFVSIPRFTNSCTRTNRRG